MLVLASDRGLCGGLNANLIKAANSAMKQKEQKGVQFELCLWGRRCYNLEKLQERTVLEKKEKILESFSYASVKAESERLAKLFFQGKYDKIYVVYPRFKNALSQEATVETLLPVPAAPSDSGVGLDESNAPRVAVRYAAGARAWPVDYRFALSTACREIARDFSVGLNIRACSANDGYG